MKKLIIISQLLLSHLVYAGGFGTEIRNAVSSSLYSECISNKDIQIFIKWENFSTKSFCSCLAEQSKLYFDN